MSYNTDHLRTAGKITVYTTFIGVVVFAIVFIFNLGESHIKEATAQSNATTTVTVVNTPPQWTASTTEVVESSSNNPTNAGSVVSWSAIGTDSNGERYYLLICSNTNAPSGTSNGAPTCNGGTQWAVSASTTSGTLATAATTSLDTWSEVNVWTGWICDGNTGTPRCNAAYTQGENATNSSPFEINHRPDYKVIWDNSPTLPGAVVTFTSTSSDSDSSGTQDRVKLIVCATAGFSTSTDSCSGTTLGSTTVPASANATATYTVIIPTQDQNYGAFGYVIDQHGFEATTTQGTNSVLSVANAAPTVQASSISLVQASGTDMYLSVEVGETPGFTLVFTTSDDNSCENSSTTDGLYEVVDYDLSIYRNGTGPITSSSTTCPITGPYDPNSCYPSSVAPTAWNLVCTASSTTCTGTTDMLWECTFPLWYIADPTDGNPVTTQYSTNDWRAQVRAIDDGQNGDLISLTGPVTESDTGVNVKSFLAFALNTLSIPYGALEPGQSTPLLVATTTIEATGNVGLDTDVIGESMCTTYTGASPCAPSATSTIPESEQVFATSTVSYATAFGLGNTLSSTTVKEIEMNVRKSRATSTATSSNAYWGINVPGTISFAGDYYGESTFTAIVGESGFW